jgi:hypothetical protein
MPDTALADRRVVLSVTEFDVAWDGLGLGPSPVVLRLPSPGRTHTERRHIEARCWAGLRARGLAGRCGLTPAADRLLRLLAAPDRRLELRAFWDTEIRAVAAGLGDDGVLALRHGDAVVLAPCASLPSAVAGALPPGYPGSGRTANVPTAALTAAVARPSGAGLRADLVDRGVDPAEAGLAARMLDGVRRRAQVSALAADRFGVLRRCREPLGVMDGPRGRYLVTRSRDDGGDWTTITPTDDRRLRHRLTELLAAADDPR